MAFPDVQQSHECIFVGRFLGCWQDQLSEFAFVDKNDSVDSYRQSLSEVTAARVRQTQGFGYYNQHNCQFFQHFDEQLPGFAHRMKDRSGLGHAMVSMIRQDPGQTIPWHKDTFFKLRQKVDATAETIFRYIVFLEDWKVGHYFQIGQTPIVKWRKGDTYTFPALTQHLSGNCGIEPKFTLQVTGVDTERSLHRHAPAEVSLDA